MKYNLIIAAIASTTAVTVQAAPSDSMIVEGGLVERVTVQTSELDTREGIDSVRLRIRRAADRVCSIEPISPDYYNRTLCAHPARHDGYAQLEGAAFSTLTGHFTSVFTA